MPYKERTIEKLYWTIGEVAAELGVNTSLIRYWEKEFGTLSTRRNGKGDRQFTAREIDRLKRIKHLVKDQGFTIQGAREQLRRKEDPAGNMDGELRQRLIAIRDKLLALRAGIDTLPGS